ncbi:unnamed protein product [Schistosoma mattheei]|uniref:Uncharacterized protein n=1 Tax=Schistosoma mattheei TaxID=31246 RepID=A0A183Q5M9_9TREM|nr:unnamed protein product [Schistosoma mattheei]
MLFLLNVLAVSMLSRLYVNKQMLILKKCLKQSVQIIELVHIF